MTNKFIQDAIELLCSNPVNLLGVQKFMILARIRQAAKLGDTDAQHFVTLCDLNIYESTKH